MSRNVGRKIIRKEDKRLLNGTAQFVADIKLANSLEAFVIRSTYAHANLNAIDKEEALQLPGVFAVITADDIEGEVDPFVNFVEFNIPQQLQDRYNPVIKTCPEYMLAKEKVIYQGQPIAVVVAENRYIAEDAAALVQIKYEELEVLTDPYEALSADSIMIHPHLENNVQSFFQVSIGNSKSAFEHADHILKARIKTPRVAGNPLETRGIVASYHERYGELQVWSSTQVPYMLRSYLSKLLNMVEDNIRVTAPDVGGGFGPKIPIYPEEILISYLAIKLKRPVRWIEDRLEHMSGTRHSRDQSHDVEVAFLKDGTITAIKDDFIQDNGAFNHFAFTCVYNTAAHLRGIYKIPNYEVRCRVVLTNKTPIVPMRGAGRPEATFTMDRIIYMIAEELKMDPLEIMKKNIIQQEEIPYPLGMLYRDGAEIIYDNGNFPKALNTLLDIIDYETFRKKQNEFKKNGKHIGIGISTYTEGTGLGPHEGAFVRIDSTGHVVVHAGASPHGQSHETTLAQVCADVLNLSTDQVTIKAGDTNRLSYGVGTFASRSAVTAGSAVHIAANKVLKKLIGVAANLLDVKEELLITEDGVVFEKGNPENKVTFKELALAAKPGRNCKVPDGQEPGLEATYYFVPPTVTWSSGFHAAEVEVDKETGFVNILRYIVVDDCGTPLNPLVVEGQIQGGVAQGIGAALYEEVVYDDNGQLLTGTYMDYLLPTSMEIPKVEMGHVNNPSSLNPLGVKGVGEGGAISPPAAIANAVIDALNPLQIKITDLPISPSKLYHLIKEAEKNN